MLFIIYLSLNSYFLRTGDVDSYGVYVIIVIYILHVIAMKFNHSYEVALKRMLTHILEVRELNRLAK